VIFFELMNSPATFQIIINKILWDLINTREIVSFINDIIVETKTKKEHDKVIVKEVKKLVENDLYIKPEKCKWKI